MDRYEEIKNLIEQYSKDYGYSEEDYYSQLNELIEEEFQNKIYNCNKIIKNILKILKNIKNALNCNKKMI